MKMANKYGGKKIRFITILIGLVTILFALLLNIRDQFVNITDDTPNVNYSEIIVKKKNQDSEIRITGKEENMKELPLQINAQGNFQDYKLCFYIPRDTTILISAVGEAADYSTNRFLFNSWDNDGVEIYFDMQNNKTPLFDLKGFDRQYRILWKSNQVDGKNYNLSGVKIKELDPSSTTYIMEITFPWKTLGYIKPTIGAKLGFEAAIMDSDSGAEKGKLNWHSKTDDNWRSTADYGTMILSGKNKPKVDTDYAIASERSTHLLPIEIDSSSKQSFFYSIKNVTVGFIRDSLDLSGRFKAEWDINNLYIQFFVKDNIKTLANALFDYGWIENKAGKVIWEMEINKLKYAGGALKNKKIDTAIILKRGYYYLKYHTDESHSPGNWDSDPPNTNFYGIKIAYKYRGLTKYGN